MEKLYKNFIWMAASNLMSSLFGIIIFLYLARVLMPAAFGYLSYASTLIFFLINFTDFGLSTYGIREIAKDKTRVTEYIANIISFKFVITLALFICVVLVTLLSRYSALPKMLMIETALMLFIYCLATEWIFQALENMRMVFISLATTGFLQLTLNYFFVKGPADLLRVPLINFFSALPIIIIFLTRLGVRFKMTRPGLKRTVTYLSASMTIWAISVCAQAYNNLDIILLGFFRRPSEVGYFTIARRVVAGGALFMLFLASALLPRLSWSFSQDLNEFHLATRRFFKLSILMTLFIFLPIVYFSKELISITVGSEYIPASTPLRIMMLALILVTFNLPYSTGLIAACHEKDVLKQAIASACLSFVLNFLLMPRYGMVGAAISFLLVESLALVWILVIYKKRILVKCEGR